MYIAIMPPSPPMHPGYSFSLLRDIVMRRFCHSRNKYCWHFEMAGMNFSRFVRKGRTTGRLECERPPPPLYITILLARRATVYMYTTHEHKCTSYLRICHIKIWLDLELPGVHRVTEWFLFE